MKPTAWAFLIAIVAGTGLNCTYDTSSLRGTGLDGGQDATANGTDGQAKQDGSVVDSSVTSPDVAARDASSDTGTTNPDALPSYVLSGPKTITWETANNACHGLGVLLPTKPIVGLETLRYFLRDGKFVFAGGVVGELDAGAAGLAIGWVVCEP